MIKVVIFDLDGVLADSKATYVETIQKVLSKYGYKYKKNQVSEALGAKLTHTLRNLRKFPLSLFMKLRKEVHDSVFYKAKSLRICPYSKKVLEKLSKKNVKIVLLTNSRRDYSNSFLKKHKILKYFDEVYGGDQFFSKKGMFKKIFRKFKVKPGEVVYVGDRTRDYDLAKMAGCKPVLVYMCTWDKESLRKKKYSRYLIKDLRDLVKKC